MASGSGRASVGPSLLAHGASLLPHCPVLHNREKHEPYGILSFCNRQLSSRINVESAPDGV